jgi:hypothetical protein
MLRIDCLLLLSYISAYAYWSIIIYRTWDACVLLLFKTKEKRFIVFI